MKNLVIPITIGLLVLGTVHSQPQDLACSAGQNAQTYPLTFINITTDREYVGFVQIYGYSINSTSLFVEAQNDSYSDFQRVQAIGGKQFYNVTPTILNSINQQDDGGKALANLGILASSQSPVYIVGVKSDKGTTDAYSALPVGQTSTEFVIAGWPKVADRPFLATIMVVAAQDDTCLEMYKIINGNEWIKVPLADGQTTIGAYQVYRYFASTNVLPDIDFDGIGERAQLTPTSGNSADEDVTGYFLNTTKPVAVYFGHECAWVPNINTLFCDYMVEQIPPRNQLGKRHFVPPILGRSAAAGYVVRVVPAYGDTSITVNSATPVVKKLGEFLEINTNDASKATYISCSLDCIVMLYNKGYLSNTVASDIPTDPFMMLIASDDRWTAGCGFATANFCLDDDVVVDFDNWVSIVTFKNYKNNVRFDEQLISSNSLLQWTDATYDGVTYSSVSFRIDHGFHFVDLAPNTFGSFSVYVYGHSKFDSSSSGYGYCANYNITDKGVCTTFPEALKRQAENGGDPTGGVGCTSEAWLTGRIVSNSFGQYAPMPFHLRAGISPSASLTPICLTEYNDELMKLLQDFSRKINTWICQVQNCTFLQGNGVAIDYDTLKITWIGSEGVYTAVDIEVTMIASLDVTAGNFASCRVSIRDYMYEFINWPPYYTSDLLHQTISGCPDIQFDKPRFVELPQECPAIGV